MNSKNTETNMEAKLINLINLNKKNSDNAINSIQRDLLAKMAKMEDDWQSRMKEMEKERAAEREQWKREADEWKQERTKLQTTIQSLETALSSREEGEISETGREEMKEEITKAMKEELEEKTKALTAHLEAAREGWVEVVKKNLKKEVKEDAKKEELLMVHTTLEEEKMRHARRLNIRITGIDEKPTSTPDMDGRELCTKLGYKNDEPTPFAKAWRVGKDLTRKRPLILSFPSEEARVTFLRKRVILRGINGTPIYLDDDLTRMQVEHRRACMPQVHQARKDGKKAAYRDGRVIIDGKTIA